MGASLLGAPAQGDGDDQRRVSQSRADSRSAIAFLMNASCWLMKMQNEFRRFRTGFEHGTLPQECTCFVAFLR